MNPIRYISSTFTDIMNDLNNDPRTADAPSFLKLMIAGIFAVLGVRLNVTTNQVFLSTATSRPLVQDILNAQDYRMRGVGASRTFLDIEIDPAATASGPYTIPVAQLIAKTQQRIGSPQYQWEGLADLTFPQSTTTAIFEAEQRQTQPTVSIGFANGQNLQILELPDTNILTSSLKLTIASEVYSPVDTLAYSTSSSLVFLHIIRDDGTSYVVMGFVDELDGTQYGKIPATGTQVFASYAVTAGANGNAALNTINVYAGEDTNVISVNNAANTSGGQAQETISNAKMAAPLRAQTHDMFWNDISGVAIAKSITGVLEAQVVITGILSASVYIMPAGGGVPSPTLLNTVRDTLIEKSFFQQIELDTNPVDYLYIGIGGTVLMLPGASFARQKKFIDLAAMYRTSEISFDLYAVYQSNGLQAAIDYINSNFFSILNFTYSFDLEGAQVKRILDNVPFQKFGEDLDPNDIVSAITGNVTGVDIVTMGNPTSRIVVSSGSITKPSSISFTEEA